MKTYTTEEVIRLQKQWVKEQTDNVIPYNHFDKWLLKKEQSELPTGNIVDGLKEYLKNTPREQVLRDWTELAHFDGPIKDQLIWVRDKDDNEEVKYQPRYFAKFDEHYNIYCYPDGKNSKQANIKDDFDLVIWDEYSLTDPNK